MKSFIAGTFAGILCAMLFAIGYSVITTGEFAILNNTSNQPAALQTKGTMDLICELQVDLDAQLELGITSHEQPRINIAKIDFDKRSGWYQGKITISENRAGHLEFDDKNLTVSRPAMIRRFNRLIRSEQFVINRRSGEFLQSLTMDDGKVINLIRGTCAKVIKAPL